MSRLLCHPSEDWFEICRKVGRMIGLCGLAGSGPAAVIHRPRHGARAGHGQFALPIQSTVALHGELAALDRGGDVYSIVHITVGSMVAGVAFLKQFRSARSVNCLH